MQKINTTGNYFNCSDNSGVFTPCFKVSCVYMAKSFCSGFVFYQSHSSISLWSNLERVTTGFSPADPFQILSTLQELTTKSVQYLLFIILVFHVRSCILLITNVSQAQLFRLRLQLFLQKKYFLPPTCRNISPCCSLPLPKQDTPLAACGALVREHLPPATTILLTRLTPAAPQKMHPRAAAQMSWTYLYTLATQTFSKTEKCKRVTCLIIKLGRVKEEM